MSGKWYLLSKNVLVKYEVTTETVLRRNTLTETSRNFACLTGGITVEWPIILYDITYSIDPI